MALDTEKQVDESIASLIKECAQSDEAGLVGVLKVVNVLVEFMGMDSTMDVLNTLLYHDNEHVASNSLAILRHLHEIGRIKIQPITLSGIEDGEELVVPIDEDMLPEEASMFLEVEDMSEELMDDEILAEGSGQKIPREEEEGEEALSFIGEVEEPQS